MKVLAFDPGFERLGVAVLEKTTGKEALLYSDCIRTSASLEFEKRLFELGAQTEALLHQWKPDCVAVEDIYFEKNEKTAMKIAEVRGMLAYLAVARGLPLHHYTPLQVKVAITGYGKSDKSAVALMLARLVSLPQKKMLDDELDAIAVGVTCLASVKK